MKIWTVSAFVAICMVAVLPGAVQSNFCVNWKDEPDSPPGCALTSCRRRVISFPIRMLPKGVDSTVYPVKLKRNGTGPEVGELAIYPLEPKAYRWIAYAKIKFSREVELLRFGYGIYTSEGNFVRGGNREPNRLNIVKKNFSGAAKEFDIRGHFIDRMVPAVNEPGEEGRDCCGETFRVVARAHYKVGSNEYYAWGKMDYDFLCSESGVDTKLENPTFSDNVDASEGRGISLDNNLLAVQSFIPGRGDMGVKLLRDLNGKRENWQTLATLTDPDPSPIEDEDEYWRFGDFVRVRQQTAVIRLRSRRLGIYKPDGATWVKMQELNMSSGASNTAVAVSNDERIAFVSTDEIVEVYKPCESDCGGKPFVKEAFAKPVRITNLANGFSLAFDARNDLIVCKHSTGKCRVLRRDDTNGWEGLHTLVLSNKISASMDGDRPSIATAGTDTDPNFIVMYNTSPSGASGDSSDLGFFMDVYGKENAGGLYSIIQRSVKLDLGVKSIRVNQFTLAAHMNTIAVGGSNKVAAHVFVKRDGMFVGHVMLRSRHDLDNRRPLDSGEEPLAPNQGADQITVFTNENGSFVAATIMDDKMEPDTTIGHFI